MEKLATDIYSFAELRQNGFTYVDKTAIILPLVNMSIGKQFFMARPRRFGKSLLISTLQCLFEGRRDLFKGLAIEDKWDWSKTWPVIRLDMGSCQAATVEELWQKITSQLQMEATRLGVTLADSPNASIQFSSLIVNLAAKSPDGQVVLLIDEYDKPLLGHLTERDTVDHFRNALKAFYSVVKTLESYQRFTFLTGVSKVSIFSDLNNLRDLSMTPDEAVLLGYTHAELKKYFPETLAKIGQANGFDADGAFAKVIDWYDGYRFCEDAEPVINPVSFGLCAEKGVFKNYWSQTATPTFLIDLLKRQPLVFPTVDVDESALDMYEPTDPRLVTLMYQTGYLTIKSVTRIVDFCRYTLGFPNKEVENAFLTHLVPMYAGIGKSDSENFQTQAIQALYAGDCEKFFKVLRCFFANIPYNLTDRQNEQMWQTIVYVVLRSIGLPIRAEVMTNEGRIDMVCDTPTALWLIEFKLDRPAEEALAQIDANHYETKFDLSAKRVIKAGISFSSEKRTIADIKVVG